MNFPDILTISTVRQRILESSFREWDPFDFLFSFDFPSGFFALPPDNVRGLKIQNTGPHGRGISLSPTCLLIIMSPDTFIIIIN